MRKFYLEINKNQINLRNVLKRWEGIDFKKHVSNFIRGASGKYQANSPTTIGQDAEESRHSDLKRSKNRHLIIVDQLRKRVKVSTLSLNKLGRWVEQ